jgi:hypothetical protein
LTMAHFGAVEWMPWSKCLSEEAAFQKRAAIVTGSPHKLAAVLHTRAIALAMVNACSFVTWKLYVKQFLKFYTADPPSQHHRSFTLEEAEAADRAAFLEALRLTEDGWSLDDALHEVSVYRDRFSVLLQHHFKAPGSFVGNGRKRPHEGSLEMRGSWVREAKGKSKGEKGKGKSGKGKSNFGGSLEPCRRFAQGTCLAGDSCRFSHA